MIPVWESMVVSLLLAIVCIALSCFSVIVSQIRGSGWLLWVKCGWNCCGWAAVPLFSCWHVVEQSSAQEQRAFLAGCGAGTLLQEPQAGQERVPCWNCSSLCQHCVGHCCQDLPQEQRVLLPCKTSMWISPRNLCWYGSEFWNFQRVWLGLMALGIFSQGKIRCQILMNIACTVSPKLNQFEL